MRYIFVILLTFNCLPAFASIHDDIEKCHALTDEACLKSLLHRIANGEGLSNGGGGSGSCTQTVRLNPGEFKRVDGNTSQPLYVSNVEYVNQSVSGFLNWTSSGYMPFTCDFVTCKYGADTITILDANKVIYNGHDYIRP